MNNCRRSQNADKSAVLEAKPRLSVRGTRLKRGHAERRDYGAFSVRNYSHSIVKRRILTRWCYAFSYFLVYPRART